jgi:hypothetical protein
MNGSPRSGLILGAGKEAKTLVSRPVSAFSIKRVLFAHYFERLNLFFFLFFLCGNNNV